jgi:hypothetical protein
LHFPAAGGKMLFGFFDPHDMLRLKQGRPGALADTVLNQRSISDDK